MVRGGAGILMSRRTCHARGDQVGVRTFMKLAILATTKGRTPIHHVQHKNIFSRLCQIFFDGARLSKKAL